MKSDEDRHQHRNYVNHKFSLWMLEHKKSGEKKKEVHFYFGFSPNAIWAISPRMPWPLSLKRSNNAKRGERLFNVNFTILIQPCCSSIQFHIKLARLVITQKKNGSFLITFTLILHLNKKTPKPRILFLKEAFTNIKKR